MTGWGLLSEANGYAWEAVGPEEWGATRGAAVGEGEWTGKVEAADCKPEIRGAAI